MVTEHIQNGGFSEFTGGPDLTRIITGWKTEKNTSEWAGSGWEKGDPAYTEFPSGFIPVLPLIDKDYDYNGVHRTWSMAHNATPHSGISCLMVYNDTALDYPQSGYIYQELATPVLASTITKFGFWFSGWTRTVSLSHRVDVVVFYSDYSAIQITLPANSDYTWHYFDLLPHLDPTKSVSILALVEYYGYWSEMPWFLDDVTLLTS